MSVLVPRYHVRVLPPFDPLLAGLKRFEGLSGYSSRFNPFMGLRDATDACVLRGRFRDDAWSRAKVGK